MMRKQEKAVTIYTTLCNVMGSPVWSSSGDAVDELIATILSANTTDKNSGRAFDQLKLRFGNDWETVRLAPLDEIKEAIRPAGMYNQKAHHLVATLEKIKRERGAYNLDHLAALPVDEALHYLTSFPGVGHKTASIVLLFCFQRAAFPVDTHIQRISRRLGICERSANAATIKTIWEELLPAETFYSLHVNLIRHGRTICQARLPQCDRCPLQETCDYFQGSGEWSDKMTR